MKISELINYLQKQEKEYGDVNVCVYNFCHEMPCESIVAQLQEDQEYLNVCEDTVEKGDFLLLK